MPLTTTERRLLEEACANRENHTAQSLLNVFGCTSAADVIAQIAAAPVTIRADFMDQVRKAVDDQRRYRTPR